MSIHNWFKKNSAYFWLLSFALLLGAIGGLTCRLGFLATEQCAFGAI